MRLRFSLLVPLAALLLAPTAGAQGAFFNEFHYDNDGADTGEFIEIAVADGVDVNDLTLTLYNGSNGTSYNSIDGSSLNAGASQNGYTLYGIVLPSNGLQNGSPDGFALTSSTGGFLQFLSYEGSFTATDGPAVGRTSQDVGVEEPSNTPSGQSLQLTGTSATYDGFTWTGPAAQSPALVNAGQTFLAPPDPPAPTPQVAFASRTLATREGDTLRVAVTIDYRGEDPTEDTVVRISFVGGASTASDDDFASPTVAVVTFDSDRRSQRTQEVEFVFEDDDTEEGSELATFRLSIVSGNAEPGQPNSVAVTVDDPAETTTVADARAAGVGESVTVVGTVSRAAGAFLYLQDETAGLAVRQTSGALFDAIAADSVRAGTRLQITGTLSEFNSLLQINGADLESFEILGQGDAPEPQVVTLEQIAENGEDYEGELVTVRGVMFAETGTFAERTTYQVDDGSDDGDAVTARTPNASDTTVDGVAIPETADVTAIVGQFSSDDPAAGYQLLLVRAEDIGAATEPEPEPTEGSVAEARDEGVGATVTFEATVSRAAGAFVYVQDETAGLAIRQTSGALFDAVAADSVRAGTRLRVTGTLSEFRALLQINGADLESFEILGQGDAPEPQVVTLAQLAADGEDFEGELVTVQNVTFVDGGGTFGPGTNYGVTDATVSDPFTARVPNADDSTVDGLAIPTTADVTGIVGQFSADDPAVGYQLLLIDADDLGDATGETAVDRAPGAEFALDVANPIRDRATVRYAVGTAGVAEVALFDVLGRRVAVLAEGPVDATERTATLDVSGLSAGVYVLRLQAEGVTVSRTVTVVR
ncbi:DUF5689 domain-containing protein [Rubrivirga sp.]|uniref:DUF5689 domain-containing protein n=1 Tax=Rubrivirga sp. TaxID=1885344 RepID=UPI003B518840